MRNHEAICPGSYHGTLLEVYAVHRQRRAKAERAYLQGVPDTIPASRGEWPRRLHLNAL
jgi:hypothetical protein